MHRRLRFLVLIFGVGGVIEPGHSSLLKQESCESNLAGPQDSFPTAVPVGVSNIHSQAIPKDGPIVFTVFHPLPGDFPARIRNMNEFPNARNLPEHLLIGDGSLHFPFIRIDFRKGSPLKLQIESLAAEIKSRSANPRDIEQVLAFELRDLLRGSSNWLGGALRKQFPQINSLLKGVGFETHQSAFESLAENPDLLNLQATGGSAPVVPLEFFLAVPERMLCFQHSWIASLILRELGLDHELVTGFAAGKLNDTRFIGHTWIQLPNGRYLDPQWMLLEMPVLAERGFSKISVSYSNRNTHFPFLELLPEHHLKATQ